MDEVTQRIIVQVLRESRDSTLTTAIELCEEFARTGHGAACCAKALRDLRDALPPVPTSMQ